MAAQTVVERGRTTEGLPIIEVDTALTNEQPRRYRTIAVDAVTGTLVAHGYTKRAPTAAAVVKLLRNAGIDPRGIAVRAPSPAMGLLFTTTGAFGAVYTRSPATPQAHGRVERWHQQMAQREAKQTA